MNCRDAAMLVAAYADGETSRLQGHSVERHVRDCPDCAAKLEALLGLRARLHAELPRYSAPPALRARVEATLDAIQPRSAHRTGSIGSRWRWVTSGALAGCAATVLAWMLGTAVLDWRASEDLAAEAVTSHVRATLGNQMIQVASSDQHTVKPWLSARLDYSPPVRDFADHGYTLVGGRIDYLDRHPVATLVYRIRNHTIDVFVRPEAPHAAPLPERNIRGFNVLRASGSGMDWLAVSDVNVDELKTLVDLLAHQTSAP